MRFPQSLPKHSGSGAAFVADVRLVYDARYEFEGIGQIMIDGRIEVYALVGRLDEVIARTVEIESIVRTKCVEIAPCWIRRIKYWNVTHSIIQHTVIQGYINSTTGKHRASYQSGLWCE